MLKVEKKSILSMLEFELLSISHSVKIGDYHYFLVELIEADNQESKIYTWEQISIIKSRFPAIMESIEKYKEMGKELQKITKWPAFKSEALRQIKQKFWDEPSPKIQNKKYEFEEEMQEEKLEKKQRNYLDQKANQQNQRKLRKEREDISKKITETIEQQELDLRFDSDEEIQNPPKQKEKSSINSENPVNYTIKKLRLQPRKGKISYIVQDNLGKQKCIRSQKLKKTHLYEVIQFLQQELDFNK